MSYTEKQADEYFDNVYKLQTVYIWGMDFGKVTKQITDRLFKTFGSATYSKNYYDSKYQEAISKQGYGSDCSGMFRNLSPTDRNSQGYYNACKQRGNMSSFDKTHSCMVFKGKNHSLSAIHHIGWYNASDGTIVEMKSSKENCTKTPFKISNWDGWGKPDFIDYNTITKVPTPVPVQETVQTTTTYPQRGIDISSYQKGLNYQQLKQNGVQFAILKIVRKDLNKDTSFETHYNGCNAAGINVLGVYNYSYATTVEKAKIDALKVLEHLAGRKLTVWLDVEDNCQKNLGARLPQIINAYQSVIEGAGLKFGVYTGLSFYNSFIKPYTSQLNTKNFWIARYYNGHNLMLINDNLDNKYKPSVVGNLIAWQFTSSGVITGSPGKLDVNILYSPISQTLTINNDAPTTKKVKITAQAGLRVRSTPDTSVSNNILGVYKYNDIVEVTEYNGSWWRTDRGFISKTYTKIV